MFDFLQSSATALTSAALPSEAAAAFRKGERSENKLTDIVFMSRHPEMRSRKIRAGEKHLADEWFQVRDSVVRPLLRTAAATSGTAATGQSKPTRSAPAGGCGDDRCTSIYIRWMQTSLNHILGKGLKINGLLDDPTINAILAFKHSRRLKTKEYFVGPVIEQELVAAGAQAPPAIPNAQCGVTSTAKLVSLLEKHRGDIPVEILLGWIEVESGRQLGSLTSICERGYFQLHPSESISLGLSHDLVGTDAEYSITAGLALVNGYRKRIDRLLQIYGLQRGSDLYWRLVKLCHWIPSAPEKILASMQAARAAATDWAALSNFVTNHSESLTANVKRNPIDGIRSVDHMFRRVEAWRQKLMNTRTSQILETKELIRTT